METVIKMPWEKAQELLGKIDKITYQETVNSYDWIDIMNMLEKEEMAVLLLNFLSEKK